MKQERGGNQNIRIIVAGGRGEGDKESEEKEGEGYIKRRERWLFGAGGTIY